MTSKPVFIKNLLIIFALITAFLLSSAVISDADSYNGRYWLKVNTEANVVTVYEKYDGDWMPVRVMLCSVGIADSKSSTTPEGTFYTKSKWQWGNLVEGLYGQYCTQIISDILFHSVYYDTSEDYASQPTEEFNKLGQPASHGCVRLSVMDSKWIYDNCESGTKVTIYADSNPGPLGKPEGIKVSTERKTYWDPTDPDSRNPYFLLKRPVISISSDKKRTIKYGSDYNLYNKVTAYDPNTLMDLTSEIEISSVKKYSKELAQYVESDFSTESIGTYKIEYMVSDPYCGVEYKTLKLNVIDNTSEPVIYGAVSKTVDICTTNAVTGVTASQLCCDRTSSIKVSITPPGSGKTMHYSYGKAKAYIFSREGDYKIRYSVKNKNYPYNESTESVTVTVRPVK